MALLQQRAAAAASAGGEAETEHFVFVSSFEGLCYAELF
jgi:hypothetical protein